MKRGPTLAAVAALACLVVAAPVRTAAQEIDASVPDADMPPGNGMIVDPTVIVLGEAAPGQPLRAEVAVTNTETTGIITVSGVNLPDTEACAPFRVVAPAALPIEMQPAQRDVWSITFTGQTLGTYECQVDFLDDDGNADFVTLSADVTAPIMTVQPPAIGFGDVAVGGEASQRISISNDGTDDLTITAIELSGAAELEVAAPALPRVIAPRTTEVVTVTYRPAAAGADMGTVTITGNDPARASAMVALSGNGVEVNTDPHLALSPDPLDLGTANVGTAVDGTLTIANDGGEPARITRLEIAGTSAGELSIEAFGCTGTQRCDTSQMVPAGGQVTAVVRCQPAFAGSKAASIVVTSTASNSPTAAALRCTGTAADIAVNPTALGFGTVRVGSQAALTFTARNNGNTRLEYTLARIGAAGGDYTVSPACSGTCRVDPGDTITHTVTFRPAAIGDRNASITIASNDPSEPTRTVTLSGVGGGGVLTLVSPVTGALPFGDIPVEAMSSPQPVQVRNDGNLNLRISSIALTGATVFSLTGNTPPPDVVVAPGRTHTVQVTCAPVTATSYAATLRILSDAPANNRRDVALTCRGIMADLAAQPAPVLFAPTLVGRSSVQRVTVRNTGNTATTISQLGAAPGVFSLENGPALPLSLAARATFTVDVRFTPTADGDVEGALTVTPQTGDPLAVALRGPARVASFAVEPAQGDLGTVCRGQSIVQRFTLRSTGSADIQVQRPALEGGDGAFTLTVLEPAPGAYPTMLAPNATATVDVTAMPTAPTTTATLRFTTDVEPNGVVTVPLMVAAIDSGVGVSPGAIAFDAVAVDDRSAPRDLALSNCGDGPLQVLDLDITGDDAAAFDVGGMVPPPSVTVPIASNIRWTVVFSPRHPGPHTAMLSIVHAAGTITVPLTGEGQSTAGGDPGPGAGGDAGVDVDRTSYYACASAGHPAGGAALVILVGAFLARRRRRAR